MKVAAGSQARVPRIQAAALSGQFLNFLLETRNLTKQKRGARSPRPSAPLEAQVPDLPRRLFLCPAPRPQAPASPRPRRPGAHSTGPNRLRASYLLDRGREPAIPREEGTPHLFV